jgi:hypothetical protein
MESNTKQTIEAAVFQRLLDHLRTHTEVQNIDLMILADFCRNCLAKWYVAEAQDHGVEMTYPQAQEIVYGMPYDQWKKNHQREATPEQLKAYEERQQRKQSP